MNTSPNVPPRFLCRIIRWWAALTEPSASSVGTKAARGHRARCPDCRAYFQSQAAIETRLRSEAQTATPNTPTGLEHRIAEAVRHAHAPNRTRPRSKAIFPLWAGGLGAATAAAILLVLFNRNAHSSTGPAQADSAEIIAVFNTVTMLPHRLNKLFTPPSPDIATADPLNSELDKVKADARSALGFFAENFLPAGRSNPTSSVLDRQPATRGT